MIDRAKLIASISACESPDLLRNWIDNARKKNDPEIADASFRRLISLVPDEQPGSVEFDFWRMVNAFENTLSEERGKTTRLSRTRQKVARVGVVATLRDWALSDQETDGFKMLLERGMAELTGEAIVLRHADKFDDDVRAAANDRLVSAGIDVAKLPS